MPHSASAPETAQPTLMLSRQERRLEDRFHKGELAALRESWLTRSGLRLSPAPCLWWHSSDPPCVSCCFPSSGPKSWCAKLLTLVLGLARPSQDFIFLVSFTGSLSLASPRQDLLVQADVYRAPSFPWAHRLVPSSLVAGAACAFSLSSFTGEFQNLQSSYPSSEDWL